MNFVEFLEIKFSMSKTVTNDNLATTNIYLHLSMHVQFYLNKYESFCVSLQNESYYALHYQQKARSSALK